MFASANVPLEILGQAKSGLRVRPKSSGAFVQEAHHLYAETHGVALCMDIFRPKAGANGLGIVDVVSGAWQSDRVRLNEHIGLGLIDVLCERGFTVFAVSPGSVSKFTGFEMVSHVRAAIRYIARHAESLGIDAQRLGVAGASAGGHLAALATLTAAVEGPWMPRLQAVGLLFAPVDLVDFGAGELPLNRLLFDDGTRIEGSPDALSMARALSPLYHLTGNPPPVYLLHGDTDPIVPFQQSVKLAEALRGLGGEVHLVLKPGGGHPWPDIRPDLDLLGDWFLRQL